MRRIIPSLAGALASVLLSGCWQQIGFDAAHTRYNDIEDGLTDANVAALEAAWSIELPGATASEPMVRDGRVFLTAGGVEADGTRAVRSAAYEAKTGDQVWLRLFQQLTSGSADYVPASFVGDELWTGFLVISQIGGRPIGDFGAPTRVNAADGTVISKGEPDVVFSSAAVTAGDRIVQTWYGFTTPQRQIAVRDKTTLDKVWTGEIPGGAPTGPPTADPAVVDGQVFVPDETNLFAYPLVGCGAPTCPVTWSLDLGSDVTSVAAAPGGDTVFALRGTDLVAVDRASGAVSWTAPLPAAAPGLAIFGDTIYVAAGTTLATFATKGCAATVCAPATETPLAGTATADPTIAGGVVYVGEPDLVEAFSVATGDPLAKVTVPGTANEMSVASGRLFVVSRAGTANSQLTAYAPAS